MGASPAMPARGHAAGDDDDRREELEALADYRATLAEIRRAIARGGGDDLRCALWRMGAGAEALHALAERRIDVLAIAARAVADYRASLEEAAEPELHLTVVR
jgi:hypothetical protein